MESTPKPRSHRATEEMMHAVQRGDLPPPPPGVVTAAAPGLTVSAKPQVKVIEILNFRSLNPRRNLNYKGTIQNQHFT